MPYWISLLWPLAPSPFPSGVIGHLKHNKFSKPLAHPLPCSNPSEKQKRKSEIESPNEYWVYRVSFPQPDIMNWALISHCFSRVSPHHDVLVSDLSDLSDLGDLDDLGERPARSSENLHSFGSVALSLKLNNLYVFALYLGLMDNRKKYDGDNLNQGINGNVFPLNKKTLCLGLSVCTSQISRTNGWIYNFFYCCM